MSTVRASSVLLAVLAVAGCVTPPPAGPSVVALPGQGKDLQAFQQDDVACRQYATARNGYADPGQAATQSAVGSAAAGTALGAVAGVLIGAATGNPGAGAAIGAGSGLVGGSVVGADNAVVASGAVQTGYDVGYTQCMVARGNTVQPTPVAGYGYPAYGYAYPAPAYYGPAYYGPAYYGPAYAVGPTLAIGIGGGWGGGWHRGWGGWHHGWRH